MRWSGVGRRRVARGCEVEKGCVCKSGGLPGCGRKGKTGSQLPGVGEGGVQEQGLPDGEERGQRDQGCQTQTSAVSPIVVRQTSISHPPPPPKKREKL